MPDSPALPVAGLHHLKFPVSDLATSLAWWESVIGAERQPHQDHRTPDGQLFGYIVRIPGLDPPVELRLDPVGAQGMRDFDPVSFGVDTEASLHRWAERFDALGVDNSGVLRGLLGWVLAVADPDGIHVRFYTHETHAWDPDNADLGSRWTVLRTATPS